MLAILNSLNVHNFLIFQPILMTLVSKFMVYRALSDKTYLLLGLRSPLKTTYTHLIGVCISARSEHRLLSSLPFKETLPQLLTVT